MNFVFSFVVAALLCVAVGGATASWYSHSDANSHHQKVRLADVSALTLSNGKMTTGRRSSPVPQMRCVGGTARCDASKLPTVVQCTNVGTDGVDVQWRCQAEVDQSVRLGRTDVSCEGYDYPDDPFILKGSCGLEYTLETTSAGYNGNDRSYRGSYYNDYGSTSTSSGSFFGGLAYFAMVALLIYSLWQCCSYRAEINRGNGFGNDGQWMDGGNNHQQGPPPYYNCGTTPNAQPQAGRPGFWTGLGLGGLMGHLFTPRRYNTGYNYGYANRGYGFPQPTRGYRGGYGGGFSGQRGGGTHTSTGFGSTNRR